MREYEIRSFLKYDSNGLIEHFRIECYPEGTVPTTAVMDMVACASEHVARVLTENTRMSKGEVQGEIIKRILTLRSEVK